MGWGDLFLCKLPDIVNLHWLARMLKKKGERPRFPPPPLPHFGEQSIGYIHKSHVIWFMYFLLWWLMVVDGG